MENFWSAERRSQQNQGVLRTNGAQSVNGSGEFLTPTIPRSVNLLHRETEALRWNDCSRASSTWKSLWAISSHLDTLRDNPYYYYYYYYYYYHHHHHGLSIIPFQSFSSIVIFYYAEMQHNHYKYSIQSIKPLKKKKRLVRKSGKTVKQSIQISQMFLHYVRNVTSNKTFKEVL